MEEELTRLQKAVLFTLYKNDPIPMTEEEIAVSIMVGGLLEMTEEEFDAWGQHMFLEKTYVKQARLN